MCHIWCVASTTTATASLIKSLNISDPMLQTCHPPNNAQHEICWHPTAWLSTWSNKNICWLLDDMLSFNVNCIQFYDQYSTSTARAAMTIWYSTNVMSQRCVVVGWLIEKFFFSKSSNNNITNLYLLFVLFFLAAQDLGEFCNCWRA